MPRSQRASTDLLSEVVRSVARATTANDALGDLASVLLDRYSLWRASVLLFSEDATHYLIAANWSVSDTVLAAGSSVAVSLTPAVLKTIETLRLGKVISLNLADVDFGMIGDVVRDEGLRSWLGAPLRSGDHVVGALSLSSSERGAFDESDHLLFEGIAAGVERHLLALVGRATFE